MLYDFTSRNFGLKNRVWLVEMMRGTIGEMYESSASSVCSKVSPETKSADLLYPVVMDVTKSIYNDTCKHFSFTLCCNATGDKYQIY